MNPLRQFATWIDILLDPAKAGNVRPYKHGKHASGHRRSPNARKIRRLRNKAERLARQAMYRRIKLQ